MNSNRIAYALDAASFLLQKIKERENIRSIILFGSVARGDATEKSDIDLFIDVVKESPKFEKEARTAIENFYDSIKYKQYWKLLSITHEIKLTIGKLSAWKELQPSIIANGITLYGKFMPSVKNGLHRTFFIWENVKPNAKRVLFNKQLFGFKQRNKFYQGLLAKYTGERLGKGCVLVPAEHTPLFLALFRKYKITVRIKRIVEYA